MTKSIGVLLGAYTLFVLIGLIPVNNDFTPPEQGIVIFIRSTAVHADFVLPLQTSVIDWREKFPAECFKGDTDSATHVAIGWGDRGFFLETETWAEFRASTAVEALFWPTDTCLHVQMNTKPGQQDDTRAVRITVEQYRRLVDYILASFYKNVDGMHQIPGESYRSNDAFFDAYGTYHCFYTCNSWIGTGMKTAGLRTPWLTPLPKTMFLYLSETSP